MGIDGDLKGCLHYNPQDEFEIGDIKNVLAVWEGDNDGDDWRWVLELINGKFVFLQGGCCYTGWDCQSNAWCYLFDDADKAAGKVLDAEDYFGTGNNVYDSLHSQLDKGKSETWREKTDKELGISSEE